METAIQLSNVVKEFKLYKATSIGIKSFLINFKYHLQLLKKNRITVLKNINLEIRKGETVGILGKNGSGKSTLLSIIAGTIKPNKGKVIVNGTVFPLLELGAGFHPELTGVENIILNGLFLGLRKKEILSKLEAIIDFSELGDFVFQPIKTYSSGMISRLAFSLAANVDPDILIIDEILAVGDAKFQEKCKNKMLEFKEKKATILLVSHSESDIKSLCNRLIILNNGSIAYDGDTIPGLEFYRKLLA
jgi:lipopolysaccharide transport system ATP-binding protein